MRPSVLLLLVLISCCGTTKARERRPLPPQPSQFTIGRHTFVDFGPPFDFYEIFIVRPSTNGTTVEKITLTPPADVCFVPTKLEIASGSINEPVATLFGTRNPCEIPEKALRHELRRRKKGLVFSGADVVMQIKCEGKTRLIRSDILDRDMFDPAPKTPEYTSWIMQLMKKLDQATGPGVWDRPIFSIPEVNKPLSGYTKADTATLRELSQGKFDLLFAGDPDRPSALFRASQEPHPIPTARLTKSVPVSPTVFVQPVYPPLAKMARIGGLVSFKIMIDHKGNVADLTFENAHPLLRAAVKKAAASWRFPKADSNQEVEMTIDFKLNCPTDAGRRSKH